MAESAFAAHVIVWHYDAAHADQPAVVAFLSAAVGARVRCTLKDRTTVELLAYLQDAPRGAQQIVSVAAAPVPHPVALADVAAVLALADLRAAADTVAADRNELCRACDAMERLLMPLSVWNPAAAPRAPGASAVAARGPNVSRSPVVGLAESTALVRTRRRARHCAADAARQTVLSAVSARLRLCDIAAHALTAVFRAGMADRAVCVEVLELNTRLLSIAAHLPEDTALVLLRPVLMSASFRVGALCAKHLDIDPIQWLRAAGTLLRVDAHHPCLVVPMFGGMVSACRAYTEEKLDNTATARAAAVLSSLVLALGGDRVLHVPDTGVSGGLLAMDVLSPTASSSSAVTAALHFLGERVVAVDEDSGMADLYSSETSMLRLCEDSCNHAGEFGGLLAFVMSVLSSAARQCSVEVIAEAESVRPVNVSGVDDSEMAAVESTTPRSDRSFPLGDIFDSRSPTSGMSDFSVAASLHAAGSSASARGTGDEVSSPPHTDSHREVGSLAFEALTWLIESGSDLPLDTEQITSAIVDACGVASLFMSVPCLSPALSNGWGSGDDAIASFAGNAAENGPDGFSTGERELIRSILDFADTAASWLQERNLSREDWSSLGESVACTSCPIDVVARVFARAPHDVVGEVMARAFVSLTCFENGHVLVDQNEITVAELRSVLWSSTYPASFLTQGGTGRSLRILVDGLSIRNLPASELHSLTMCRAVVLLGLVDTALRSHVEGSDAAGVAYHSMFEVLEAELGLSRSSTGSGRSLDTCEVGEQSSAVSQEFKILCTRVCRLVPDFLECYIGLVLDAVWVWPSDTASRGLPSPDAMGGFQSEKEVSRKSRLVGLLVEVAVGLVNRLEKFVAADSHSPMPSILTTDAFGEPRQHYALEVPSTGSVVSALCHASSGTGFNGPLHFLTEVSETGLVSGETLPLRSALCIDTLARHLASSSSSEDSRPRSSPASVDAHGLLEYLRATTEESSIFIWKSKASRLKCTSPDDWYREWNSGAQDMKVAKLRSAVHVLELGSQGLMVDAVSCALTTAAEALYRFALSGALHDHFENMGLLRTCARIASRLGGSGCALEATTRFWIRCMLQSVVGMEDESDFESSSDLIVNAFRVCNLIENAGESRSATETLVDVLKEPAEAVLQSLQYVLADDVPRFSNPSVIHSWMLSKLPRARLDTVLERLLIPVDDSAVRAEFSARALRGFSSILAEGSVWGMVIVASLNRMCERPETLQGSFAYHLCRSSVLDSATSCSSVISFLGKVFDADRIGVEGSSSWVWVALLYKAGIAILKSEAKLVDFSSFERLVEYCALLAGFRMRRIEDSHLTDISIAVPSGPAEFAMDMALVASDLATSAACEGPSRVTSASEKIFLLVSLLRELTEKAFSPEHADSNTRSAARIWKVFPDLRSADGSATATNPETVLERARVADMASTLCTFTETGSQFVEQHWYFCHTCDLIGTEGVCVVCAHVCHAGHDLSYSRHSRFFCDCGATSSGSQAGAPRTSETGVVAHGAVSNGSSDNCVSDTGRMAASSSGRVCICLRPRVSKTDKKVVASAARGSQKCAGVEARRIDQLLSLLFKDDATESGTVAEGQDERIPRLDDIGCLRESLSSASYAEAVVRICRGLLIPGGLQISASAVAHESSPVEHLVVSKVLVSSQKVVRSGGFAVFKRPPSMSDRRLGPSTRREGMRIAVSMGTQLLAYLEGTARIAFRRLRGFDGLADSNFVGVSMTDMGDMGKVDLAFDVQSISFCLNSSRHLLAVGMERVSIITLDTSGPPLSTVELSIGLDTGEYSARDTRRSISASSCNVVLRAEWVRGSRLLVSVTTQRFVKVFDVSEDPVSPMYFLELPSASGDNGLSETTIVDSVICASPCRKLELFLLAGSGDLFRADLASAERGPVASSRFLVATDGAKPIALGMTIMPDKLWLVCSDGSLRFCKIQDCLWKRLQLQSREVNNACLFALDGSGERLLVLGHNGSELTADLVNIADPETVRVSRVPLDVVDKLCGFFCLPLSMLSGTTQGTHCCFVQEDGSVYLARAGECRLSGSWLRKRDIGSWRFPENVTDIKMDTVGEEFAQAALRTRPGTGNLLINSVPSVVGFFESCQLVLDDVSLGGDIKCVVGGVRSSSRGRIAPSPTSGQDSFVGPSPHSVFRVVVKSTSDSICLVGVRLQIGVTERSRTQCPGEIRVFGRLVKWSQIEVSAKRWIDVPITVPECSRSPKEIVLEFEPRRQADGGFCGDGTVMFDALQVYGIPTSELSDRSKKFEAQASQFVNALSKVVSDRRDRRLSDFSSVRRRFNEIAHSVYFDELDPWSQSLVSALSMLARPDCKVAESLAISLRSDLDLHESHVEIAAFRRFCNFSSTLKQRAHVLWYEWVTQLYANTILSAAVSESHLREVGGATDVATCSETSRLRYIADVCMDQVVPVLKIGEGVSALLQERILFGLSRAFRDLVAADDAPSFPLSSDFPHRNLLPCLTSAFRKLESSDLVGVRSIRDFCANYVDLLYGVAWTSVCSGLADKYGDDEAAAGGVLTLCTNGLLAAVMSPAPELRLYVVRHVIDLVQATSPRSSLKVSMHVTNEDLWIFGNPSSRAPSGIAADTHLRNAVSEVDDGHLWTFQCDICGEVCESVWWHCAECKDFDLCEACVRKKGDELPAPHSDSHLLLRGVQDSLDATPFPPPSDVALVDRAALHVFRGLKHALVEAIRGIPGSQYHGLQLLEAVQLLHRLVSPPTSSVRRSLFLAELFQDNDLISCMESLVCKTDVTDWGVSGIGVRLRSSAGFPGNRGLVEMESLYLLLRLLACIGDVAAVPYVLSSGSLELISKFLEPLVNVVEGDFRRFDGAGTGAGSGESGSIFGRAGVEMNKQSTVVPLSDEVDISVSILSMDQGSRQTSGVSAVFSEEPGVSPAMEAVESVLQILDYCLSAVAGAHFDKHVKVLPVKTLSVVAFWGGETSGIDDKKPETSERSPARIVAERTSKLAKSVLRNICGSAKDVDLALDSYLLEISTGRLLLALKQCNERGTEAGTEAYLPVARALVALHNVASHRPENWGRFVEAGMGSTSKSSEASSALGAVFDSLCITTGEARLQALDLVSFAVRGNQSGRVEDAPGLSDGAELAWTPSTGGTLSLVAKELAKTSFSKIHYLIREVILRASDSETRRSACSILQNFVTHIVESGNKEMLDSFGRILVHYLPGMVGAGKCGLEFVDVVCASVEECRGRVSPDDSWLVSLGSLLLTLVRMSASTLSSHPNAHLYKQLSSVVAIEEYFLEADPCISCSLTADLKRKKSLVALESIRAEAKYTHKSIFSKLVSRHNIFGVSVKISDPSKSRYVRKVSVFYSTRTVADAAELKSKDHDWKRCASLDLTPGQTTCSVDLDVPLVAANLMVEFSSFYDGVQPLSRRSVRDGDNIGTGDSSPSDTSRGSGTRLQCPRCSRQVTDRYGICRSCGENSFQCRACRNIMYEVLDGFICNECGYCKHGRFEFSLKCTPSYAAEPVTCESDRKRSVSIIEQEATKIQRCLDELRGLRSELLNVLSVPAVGGVGIHDASPGKHDAPPSEAQSVSAGTSRRIDSQSAVDMDILLRTVIGEDGLNLLPSALAVAAGSSGSPDVPGSLRDIASHFREHGERDRGSSTEDSSRRTDSRVAAESADDPGSSSLEKLQKNHRGTLAGVLYDSDCRKAFLSMSRSIRFLTATRRELGSYASSRLASATKLADTHKLATTSMESSHVLRLHEGTTTGAGAQNCYGCAQAFLARAIPLLSEIMKISAEVKNLSDEDFAVILLRSGGVLDSEIARVAAREVITTVIQDNPSVTRGVCKEVVRKVEFCIDAHCSIDVSASAHMELAILADFANIEDVCWEERLRMTFSILFRATARGLNSVAVSEQIIMPCLRTACEFLELRPDDDGNSRRHTNNGSPSQSVDHTGDAHVSSDFENQVSADGSGESSRQRAHDGNSPSEDQVDKEDGTYVLSPGCIDAAEALVREYHENAVECVPFRDWMEGRQDYDFWIERFVDPRLHQAGNETDASERIVLRQYFQAWRRFACSSRDAHQSSTSGEPLGEVSWAMRLALSSPSAQVRGEACRLLENLCVGDEVLVARLLDSLLDSCLKISSSVGIMSVEYFDLVDRLLEPAALRVYLVATGFLSRAAACIEREGRFVYQGEAEFAQGNVSLNLYHGYVLHRLAGLFKKVLLSLKDSSIDVRRRIITARECEIVSCLVNTFLSVKQVVSLRTKVIDQCEKNLQELLSSPDFLYLQPFGESVVSTCVAALEEAHSANNVRATATLLDLMCGMLCPTKEEAVYDLVLEKASSQEEFIRGNMTRETYPSTEFDGPLMRDVKRKICQDLDLMSLLEDDLGDFGLELLVAGNLIKLDLPVASVYEHVWRGSAEAAQIQQGSGQRRSIIMRRGRGGRSAIITSRGSGARATHLSTSLEHPPMYVTYRLSGLDGEATEPIIESLPDSSANAVDPEEEFQATKVLGQVSGLSILLSLLSRVGSWSSAAESSVREPALKLLRASCEVASNRLIIASLPGSIGVLMDCVVSALDRGQENLLGIESAESLSIATEKIMSEHGVEFDGIVGQHPLDSRTAASDDSLNRLQVVLDHLRVVSSAKAEASLLHLVPYLMRGSQQALELVIDHFVIDWNKIESCTVAKRLARQLAIMLESSSARVRSDAFCAQLLRNGVGRSAMDVIHEKFPMPKSESEDIWKSSLRAEGPALALNVLKGMAMHLKDSREDSQLSSLMGSVVFEPDMICALTQLELAVSSMGVGSAAEELLEQLIHDGKISARIFAERAKIRQARRAAAEAYRAAAVASTLLSSSMVQASNAPGPSATSSAGKQFSFLDDVEDEVGPACVVCGDGFTSRPNEAMGVYVYSRRVLTGSQGEDVSTEDDVGEQVVRSLSRSQVAVASLFVGSQPYDGPSLIGSRRARTASSSGTQVFSNVTHFNAIHLACHRESGRADRSQRPPRDEWEGATLRNSQTKCNNIYPLKPPGCFSGEDAPERKKGQTSSVADSSYDALLNFYYGRLSSMMRVSVSQPSQCVHDLAQSVIRYGSGSSACFAEHAKGGGPHSNACLIPHLLQLLWHGMWDSKSLALPALSTTPLESAAGDPVVRPLYLALSLGYESLETWQGTLNILVQQLSEADEVQTFREIAFVDSVNRCLKADLDPEKWQEALSSRIGTDEGWLISLSDEIVSKWECGVCDVVTVKDLEQFLASGAAKD